MKYAVKKANERFGGAFGTDSTHFQKEEEGSITIDDSQTNKKKSNPSVGEYIDYEEIE